MGICHDLPYGPVHEPDLYPLRHVAESLGPVLPGQVEFVGCGHGELPYQMRWSFDMLTG